eukprot:TRINITY_DN3952_c0_g1_i1.p1 TRINITY_DN3952_c0_g1~~TRINITY_DN3952_c0_g1_i1.p1  ORF type:complete len:483 (+),score=64.24 TRINITY_DN3952_c0_g1_i1:157-1605(+)
MIPCRYGLECRNFQRVKAYQYSQSDVDHVGSYKHGDPIPCRFGRECRNWLRLCDGGYRLDDLGHCAIYQHRARVRGDSSMWAGIHKFGTMDPETAAKAIANDFQKIKQYTANTNLWEEVRRNGYQQVFTCQGGLGGPISLDEVVQQKMAHPRHAELGSPLNNEEMLSFLLYSGTDCYADLRSSERAGNYTKWARFAAVLDVAIYNLALAAFSKGMDLPPMLYHGLGSVVAETVSLPIVIDGGGHDNTCYETLFVYPTFVSTTWNRAVAVDFLNMNSDAEATALKGMLMNVSSQCESPIMGADISWISKFPQECEVLLSRFSRFQGPTFYICDGDEDQDVHTTRGRAELLKEVIMCIKDGIQEIKLNARPPLVFVDIGGMDGRVEANFFPPLMKAKSAADKRHVKHIMTSRCFPLSVESTSEWDSFVKENGCKDWTRTRDLALEVPAVAALYPIAWDQCEGYDCLWPTLHLLNRDFPRSRGEC